MAGRKKAAVAFAGEPVKKNVAGKNNRDSGSLSPGKNVGGHSIGIVMIRERRLPSNILDRLPSLINVLKDNEAVQALYFFGSLSRGQLHKPVTTPESYADIFLELARVGALPSDFVETMVQMVKFRNRLVHIC